MKSGCKPEDTIRIGPYSICYGRGCPGSTQMTPAGCEWKSLGLNKWVRKDLNLLKNMSLVFQPREFIVVVGQSGGGKSTLVDAVAGYRPATNGRGAGQWDRCL